MFESLQPVVHEFIVTLVTGLLAILSGFLIALAKKGFNWITAKIDSIKDEKVKSDIKNATETLETIVSTTVVALQQSIGDDIRESLAAGDGKFTKEDLLNLKDQAVETVKHQLTESTTKILEGVYSDLDGFIRDLIEASVRSLKTDSQSVVSHGSTKTLLNE